MGSRSAGGDVTGVPKRYVRMPGVLVRADVCIPRAHPHAAWLLPWVEALLRGRSWAEVLGAPPWPTPADGPLVRHLRDTLIDLGWATPAWSTPDLVLDPALTAAFQEQGRPGLARVLFDADVVRGEWWADALSGVLLSRQAVTQFDYDGRRRADVHLEGVADPLSLLEAAEPDLEDLLRKLGQVEALSGARDHAFLASPFVLEERKDLLFPLYGAEVRVLPDELAELEPVLWTHAPDLLGRRQAARSRVVRLAASPVEAIAAEVERLPLDPVALGPLDPARERVARLGERIDRAASELEAWLRDGVGLRPVAGPTERHFDAVAEVCASLSERGAPVLLVTTAFLNPDNAGRVGGLADAFSRAPASARFLVVYGHATDELPAAQRLTADAWLAALLARAPCLHGRVTVAVAQRRSHEKVLLSSGGDWMVGSWNAGSGRPGSPLFEVSVAGRDPRLAATLLDRLAGNVEGAACRLVDALREGLAVAPPCPGPDPAARLDALRRARALVERALPEPDGSRGEAWTPAMWALHAALGPFRETARVELLDEHQTRDALLAHVRAARRDVLVTTDRLVQGALDRATLRDLRGEGRTPRLVRLVWGREWARKAPADAQAREQVRRARGVVRNAREQYGEPLLTSADPMENHAKVLVVDGLRGLVTSENLLSYGGEKDAHESRELGLAFWSPVVARHLLGRALHQWPDALPAALAGRAEAPLAWAIAGNEAWHALADLPDEPDFDWEAPGFVEAVVADEVVREDGSEPPADARRRAWAQLSRQANAFSRVHEEAIRLGLAHPGTSWRPWDAPPPRDAERLLADAERAVAALAPRPVTAPPERKAGPHPLVARVLAEMVRIPEGSFWMGDERVAVERPRHRVHITRPFLLGRTAVTQDLWKEVMGWLPHLEDFRRHPRFPIVQVTHEQMLEFVARLRSLPGGEGFDLPTEAQWEYACRGGTQTRYHFGDDPGWGSGPGLLERYAWTKRNSDCRLQPVGQLAPNAFGLHDMHGLVYEAVRDPMRRYTSAEVRDPVGRPGEGPIGARGGFSGRFPVDPRDPAQEHFRCAARQRCEKSHRVSVRLACRVQEDG